MFRWFVLLREHRVFQMHTAVSPGSWGPAFCRRHTAPPPSPTEPAEPSTGSHCAELGQQPRRRGRHTMSPGAPGIGPKASFLNCPALCGMAPHLPPSP